MIKKINIGEYAEKRVDKDSLEILFAIKLNELIDASNEQEKKINFIMENTERNVVNENSNYCVTLKKLYEQ